MSDPLSPCASTGRVRRGTVVVRPGPFVDAVIELLAACAAHCGMKLAVGATVEDDVVGVVMDGGVTETGGGDSFPSFTFFAQPSTEGQCALAWSADATVPRLFQHRVVAGSHCLARPLGIRSSLTRVLSTADGDPVWTTRRDQGRRHDECRVPEGVWTGAPSIVGLLHRENFFWLLPFLEWLRDVSGWNEWSHPGPRACLMFDDPNLHSASYGYLSFAELAFRGRAEGFHTAIATVPFDHYRVDPTTARLFRENPLVLSLLIHGNNHTYKELAQPRTAGEERVLARQALARMRRLEARSGLTVARLMAPPHGACSQSMMRALEAEGFEGACISHGSVRAANRDHPWTRTMGLTPSTQAGGLPIFPRFRLAKSIDHEARVAAYLGQPIIPVGHHWDLADGVEILSAAARGINSLGEVRWSDVADLARRSYSSRQDGAILRVMSHARVIRVTLPPEVSTVSVESAVTESGEAVAVEGVDVSSGRRLPSDPENPWAIGSGGATEIEISISRQRPDEGVPDLPRTPLMAAARRVLAEGRDRLMPYLPGLLRSE